MKGLAVSHPAMRHPSLHATFFFLAVAAGCQTSHLDAARDFAEKQQSAEALKEYELALREDPTLAENRDFQKECSLVRAREIHRQGKELEHIGKVTEAAGYYQESLGILDALISSATRTQMSGGDPVAMQEKLKENADLETLYGQDVRQTAEALERSRKAALVLLLQEAVSAASQGDQRTAARLVKQANALNSDLPEVKRAVGSLDPDTEPDSGATPADQLYLAGVSLQNQGNWDGARKNFAAALAAEPMHLGALAAQAQLKKESDKAEAELEPVRQALKEHKLDTAAKCLRRIDPRHRFAALETLQKQSDEASMAFAKVMADAETLAKNGRWNDALAQLGRAGEMNVESRGPDYVSEQVRASARAHYETTARQRLAENRHEEALQLERSAIAYLPLGVPRQLAWRQFFQAGAADLLQRQFPGAAWLWLGQAKEAGALTEETAAAETACLAQVMARHRRHVEITVTPPPPSTATPLATLFSALIQAEIAKKPAFAAKPIPGQASLTLDLVLASANLNPARPLKTETRQFRRMVNGRPFSWTSTSREYSRAGTILYPSLKFGDRGECLLQEKDVAWTWEATGRIIENAGAPEQDPDRKESWPVSDEDFQRMFLEKLARTLASRLEQVWLSHDLLEIEKLPSTATDEYGQRMERLGERLILLRIVDPAQAEAEWRQAAAKHRLEGMATK